VVPNDGRGLSKKPGLTEVTVWSAASRFFHTTLVPTGT
jgi:hypothetical protein